MIQFDTVREVLDFIDNLDGYGLVSEDDGLLNERLRQYDLIDDYGECLDDGEEGNYDEDNFTGTNDWMRL